MIVNWLLTRRCNRRCSYCGIVHDPKRKSLKKIKDINDKEISLDMVYDSILAMNRVHNPKNLFHIFYGGEPFLKEGFTDFLKRVNKNEDIYYTVITNGTMQKELIETFHEIGKYRGLTVSLDPMVMEKAAKSFNDVKNNSGLEVLKLNKELNLTDDMVIECVFDKQNIKYAKDFLDMMKKEYPEVSISISFYDYPKNENYDFALNPTATSEYIKSMRLSSFDKEVNDLFRMLQEGDYNIHLGKNENFLEELRKSADSEYFCKLTKNGLYKCDDEKSIPDFKTLTIDADGEFRLCLRVAGRSDKHVHKIYDNKASTDELIENIKILSLTLAVIYSKECEGCAWSCPMMDEYWDDENKVSHNQ
jgi:MoaA/NifB/PqqE/SkfB family radical SAM enzyme